MNKKNRNREEEEEKFCQGASFMLMGVVLGTLLSMTGSIIINYLGVFSKDLILKNPLGHAIMAAGMTLFFFTVILMMVNIAYMLRDIRRKEDIPKATTFLSYAWKNSWRWYIYFVAPVCTIMFLYLHNNATSLVL